MLKDQQHQTHESTQIFGTPRGTLAFEAQKKSVLLEPKCRIVVSF